ISVRVLRLTPVKVPSCDFLPDLTCILCAVQIDATANDVTRLCRMHDDRISVRYLPFPDEMAAADTFPRVATVRLAKPSYHQILVSARRIHCECIQHVGF